MYRKKEFAKNLHQFILANKGADKGLGIRADAGNFFLNFWTSISRGEMINLWWFFFSLVNIEDGNVLQKKNLEYLLSFSSADTNANGGWGQATNGSISLTKSSTPIFWVIMIGFRHSFFSWILI
jgi:hypothetical protein